MKRLLLLLLAVLAVPATLLSAQTDADKSRTQSDAEAQDHRGDHNATAGDLAHGVVVEDIKKNSAGEKAGLQEGDVLLHWVRGDAHGDIDSPFDLEQTEVEQEPRGTATLEGLRRKDNEKYSWIMGADSWNISARPQLAGTLLSIYREGRELEKADNATMAAERWRVAASQAHTDNRPWLSSWFLWQAAKLWAAKQQWKEADAAYAEAIQGAAKSGPWIKVQILRAWATIYYQRSDWANTEKCFQQSIIEGNKLGETLIAAASLNGLGTVAYRRGDLAQAEMYYRQQFKQTAGARTLQYFEGKLWPLLCD